ncbi:PDZ/DHR/GLGF domain protein [Opisthorchis viverrini]|uniref:PDZ/DHR/GLGF domain protein n=1 Tax=Opisthorchis viverrini TaxID=6198 RepID=A0A1S8WJP0_OPIVI|nr:PDZ/DHR/GLGF domain protein [Opisthorchis viverrini]
MNSVQISDNPFNPSVVYDNLPVQRNNTASAAGITLSNECPANQLSDLDQKKGERDSQHSFKHPSSIAVEGFLPIQPVDDGVLNASPPCISSSPPLFEPPPLPHILAVPPVNGNHPQPRYPITQGLPSFPITVPSAFPSPCSAFTELQPRNSRSQKSPLPPRANPDQQTSIERQSLATEPPRLLLRVPKTGTESNSDSVEGDHFNVHSPIQYDALTSSVSSARSLPARNVAYCSVCGQSHDVNKPHRYNYTQAIDADLCCTLCYQPLIDPLDTKCGHTFCTPCLKNHLAVQALCPVDRQIINYLECQQASKIVKRLLDKLLVACPNSQFCNVVLERSGLEEHLRERCPGSPGSSDNAGCCRSFDDSSLTRHRHTSTKERFPPISAHISGAVGSASSTVSRKAIGSTQSPLTGSRRTAGFTPRLLAGSHTSPFQPVHVLQSCDRVRPDVKLPLSDIDETYDAPVVKEGVPVSVVIRRSPGCADLGFTFVGGVDTPLSCVLIQEIYLDGAVALDGRLRPGDQILELGIILPVLFSSCFLRLNTSLCRLCYFPERLDSRSTSLNLCTRPSMYSDILASHHEHKNDVKVNGHPITTATHLEAHQQLTAPTPIVQLTVFRESVSWNARQGTLCQTQEEIFCVKLCKRQGKVLGIKLVGKKHLPGLYVLDLVPGCEADCDGRLQKDDQILEINGIDLSNGTQEQAAHIINTASDVVSFKVSRRSRADTPDILRATNDSSERMDLSTSLRITQFGMTRKEKDSSLDQIRFDKTDDTGMRTQQRSRSVQSEGGVHTPQAGGSHRTETSSLHAFRTPSSVSEADITNSTSHLIVDDEDRGTSGHVNRTDKMFSPRVPIERADQNTASRLPSHQVSTNRVVDFYSAICCTLRLIVSSRFENQANSPEGMLISFENSLTGYTQRRSHSCNSTWFDQLRQHINSEAVKFDLTPGKHSLTSSRAGELQNLSLCQERSVELRKLPEEPLGVTVAGGRHSQRGDTPVYVTNISPDCVLGRNQLLVKPIKAYEKNGTGEEEPGFLGQRDRCLFAKIIFNHQNRRTLEEREKPLLCHDEFVHGLQL